MAQAPALHPTAQALLDRRLPLPVRSILYPLSVIIAATITWASLAEVDRVVTAPGRMVTTERPMVVQPFERGVVRSIEVAAGQRVVQGQVLATLDPTMAETAERELASRRDRLAAQVARLSAEAEGAAFAPAPATEAEAMEARLSTQRIAEFTTRLAGFEAAERRLVARQESLAPLLRSLEARLGIARDVEAMRQDLRLRDAGTRLSLLQAQADRLTLEESIAGSRAELEDLRRQMATGRTERAGFEHAWRKEVAERLIEARRELDGLTQQLAAAQRRRELVVLRAPSDGIVLEVARRSVGSVVQEAETLVTLVPASGALEAEVEIGPSDVGHVQAGATARVKLSALSFQRHGLLEGAVRLVDADALPSASRLVHRARIEIPEPTLRGAPAGFRLLPGMEVQAEVNVGRRTVISYFLEPILRVQEEGLREK
jgi:HlyD family secretion protein